MASLARACATALPLLQASAGDLAARHFERVVFLGSNGLQALAAEAALKMLELTDGRIVALAQSALGFRHGPKTVVNDRTLVVVFVSNDPYTRAYDLDLLEELRRDARAGAIVAVGAGAMGDARLELAGMSDASDLELALRRRGVCAVSRASPVASIRSHTRQPQRRRRRQPRGERGDAFILGLEMAPMFLGVDGGGTKTAYVLIDAHGELRASHVGGSVSHLSEGFGRAEALLVQGVRAVAGRGECRCLAARLRFLRAAIVRRGQRHHFPSRRTSGRCASHSALSLRQRHDR